MFVYLAASPLFNLTITLVVFQLATWLYRRTRECPLLQPVLVSVVVLGAMLQLMNVPYRTYFDGAQFIHFLLGPATVALAVPLHRQLGRIRAVRLPLVLAVVCGSLTAIVSATGLGWSLGAGHQTLASLAPKSATAPVAMELSRQLGGLPSLTAALTVMTGIIGAVVGPAVAKVIRACDSRAVGLSLGVASHGIGTARALQIDEIAGAFAALGFALNAVATSALASAVHNLIP
ncbi:MAG: hypothetical protein CK429_06155 [Mycobacterium sp.]|nr:MAG: hypothetical protein CK429_06155 [Mycobacterium sp.]PJE24001.1 MAG: hypothetical protein CK431_08300 [Mycobacterium sp.]